MSMGEFDEIANERAARHTGKPTRRPFSREVTDIVGIAGEAEFGRVFGFPVDTSRKNGDGGVDFYTPAGTVDVKTYIRPYRLLVEQKKARADIYVLAGYDAETKRARLMGWCWKAELLRSEVADFGKRGIMSYGPKASSLLPMSALKTVMERASK